MRAVKKSEQETIITFNKEDNIAYVFTYEKVWHSHFINKLGLKPTEDNGVGGLFFELPKTYIRKPQKSKRKVNNG